MGKLSSTDLFNVGMGSYNEVEIGGMIGLLLLNEIKTTKLFKICEFRIFRDYGLAVI